MNIERDRLRRMIMNEMKNVLKEEEMSATNWKNPQAGQLESKDVKYVAKVVLDKAALVSTNHSGDQQVSDLLTAIGVLVKKVAPDVFASSVPSKQ